MDPLDKYREIDGLYVVGPLELDKLFRTAENPLGLRPGWIPEVRLETVGVDLPTLDAWISSRFWRADPKWDTDGILILMAPDIGGITTGLVGQNILLGMVNPQDQIPGLIRRNQFQFSETRDSTQDKDNQRFMNEPVASWRYLFLSVAPVFMKDRSWQQQQTIVDGMGTPITTLPRDLWAMNMVCAIYDKCLLQDVSANALGLFHHAYEVSTIIGLDGTPQVRYARHDTQDPFWEGHWTNEQIRNYTPGSWSDGRDNLSASISGIPKDFLTTI